jgi:integrase/recombinase XerD
MTYAFARIGAVVAMKVEDYYPEGKRWWVRLHEKSGKRHEMPAHHKLEAFMDEYLAAAGIRHPFSTFNLRSPPTDLRMRSARLSTEGELRQLQRATAGR